MIITLPHHYCPRPYQVPLWRAIDAGCKRAVIVWHRRSGKEKTCLNIVSKKMMQRVGAYFYMFPELNQGRKVLWDGVDKEGFKFLDHFPKELRSETNNTEMKIKYKNGSIFQIIGSDRFNSVMSTNPVLIVFAEYALQNPAGWGFFRPILAENGGIAIFDFTPRGENHGYDIFELAKADPFDKTTNPTGWFSQVVRASDSKTIPQGVLDQEKREIVRLHGNDALYQQEYECSFSVPIVGSYYAHQIQMAYADGRIGHVSYDSTYPVDTWWDLGVDDQTSIWFTQSIGTDIFVLEYYENTGQGMPHYVDFVKNKKYSYGTHTAPHDMRVREWLTGKARIEVAEKQGIKFQVCPKIPLADGIEAVRNVFARCWFDSEKCRTGLNALKSYHKQWNDERKCFDDVPFHDWSSNGADSFRTMAVGRNDKLIPKPHERLKNVDAMSYREWESVNKRIAERGKKENYVNQVAHVGE